MLGLCDPFLAGSPRSDWPQRPPWTPGTPGENLAGSLLPVCFLLTHLPFAPPPIFVVCVSVCACACVCLHGPHVEVRSSSFTVWVPGIKPRSSDLAAVPLPGSLILSVYDVHSPVHECDCLHHNANQTKCESPRMVRSWCFFTCLRAFLWFFYCVLGANWPVSFSSPCRGLQKLMVPVRLLHGSGNLNSDPLARTASAFTH